MHGTIPDNSSNSKLSNSLINVGSGAIPQLPPDDRKMYPKNGNFRLARNRSWRRWKFCDSLQGLSQAATAAAAAATRDSSQAPYCSMLQQHRQSRNLSRKNVHIFQPKPSKLATRRSARASRTRFPSCHIYQLRLWLKFGILEAWSWSAVCPRLATVGLASSTAAATAAKMALSLARTAPPATRHGF